MCKNFSTVSSLKEIDVAESKGIDELKESEGLDIRILLLTLMHKLEIINGEAVKEEETQQALQLLRSSSVN